MRMDFRAPNAWAILNEKLAEALDLVGIKGGVHAYQGIGHALTEILVGVSRLYPLKKKIYWFKNMNPLFEPALTPLAKEGYRLIPLDMEALRGPEKWIKKLDREDLLVLYSADEPLLGKSYDVELFESALKESSLIKIRVSHSRHFYESDFKRGLLDRNKASLFTVSPRQAIAVLGERVQMGALVADKLSYDEDWDLHWAKTPLELSASSVLRFESHCVAGASPIFSPDAPRILDRAAVYWPDLDGHAVIDRLARQMGFELKPPGWETRMETASLSRWGGVRTMDFLKAQGLTPEMIRGLVLISHDLLRPDQIEKLESHLINVHRSIMEDQHGC